MSGGLIEPAAAIHHANAVFISRSLSLSGGIRAECAALRNSPRQLFCSGRRLDEVAPPSAVKFGIWEMMLFVRSELKGPFPMNRIFCFLFSGKTNIFHAIKK